MGVWDISRAPDWAPDDGRYGGGESFIVRDGFSLWLETFLLNMRLKRISPILVPSGANFLPHIFYLLMSDNGRDAVR